MIRNFKLIKCFTILRRRTEKFSNFGVENIKVLSSNFYYDEFESEISKSLNFLHYQTKPFNCKLKLQFISGHSDSRWHVGVVQACENFVIKSQYGQYGSIVEELHPLICGKYEMVKDNKMMISDSGWIKIKKGFVKSNIQHIARSSSYYNSVPWTLPYNGGVNLTAVTHEQHLWGWLVAVEKRSNKRIVPDLNCDNIYILNTFCWSNEIKIKVYRDDCFIEKDSNIHRLLKSPVMLPCSVLSPPFFTDALSVIWCPIDYDSRELVKPPRKIICSWENWINKMIPNSRNIITKPKRLKRISSMKENKKVGSIVPM